MFAGEEVVVERMDSGGALTGTAAEQVERIRLVGTVVEAAVAKARQTDVGVGVLRSWKIISGAFAELAGALEIGTGFEVVAAEEPEQAQETPGFDRSLQGLMVPELVVAEGSWAEKMSWGLCPLERLVDLVPSSLP